MSERYPKLPARVLNLLAIAAALSLPATNVASSTLISPETTNIQYSAELQKPKPDHLDCAVQNLLLEEKETWHDALVSPGFQPDTYANATLLACTGSDGKKQLGLGSVRESRLLSWEDLNSGNYKVTFLENLNTPDSRSSPKVLSMGSATDLYNCFNYALRETFPEVFKGKNWTCTGLLEFISYMTDPVVFLTRTDTFEEGEKNGLLSPLSTPFAEDNTFVDHISKSSLPLIPGWSSETSLHEAAFHNIDPRLLSMVKEGDLLMLYAVQEKPEPLVYPIHAGVVHFDKNGNLRIISKFGSGPLLETTFNQALFNYGIDGPSAVGIYRPKPIEFRSEYISGLFDLDHMRDVVSTIDPP